MKFFIICVVSYVVILSLLLAVAVAVGLLLHWMVPSLDTGFGVLVGTLATIASGYLFFQMTKIMQFAISHVPYEYDGEDEEDEDASPLPRYAATRPSVRRRIPRRKR